MKTIFALFASASAYQIQPIGSADPTRLSVKEYGSDSVTYIWPANPDATSFDAHWEVMENENHQITAEQQLGETGNEFTITAGAGQVIKNLEIIEKGAGGNATSSYGEGMGRMGGSGAYVTDANPMYTEWGNHVQVLEGRLLLDMSAGSCAQEATFTFGCTLVEDPVLFNGNENATVSSYDAATNTLTVVTTQAFDSAYIKFQAKANMTTDCSAFDDMAFVSRTDTTFMTVGTPGTSAIEAAPAVTLVVEEQADSRFEDFPDTSRPVVIAGEHADEDNVYKLNATMVVYTAEIPASTDKVTCLPELTISFNAACNMNEINLYGMTDTTMAGTSPASHTTTLANMDVAQIAIMVIFDGNSVEGACDATAQKPTIEMNYNRIA